MSFNVGDLIAYLRLDSKGFEESAARAQAMADKLDGKHVDVEVKADTAAAEAKLGAVAASEDKVDRGNKKIATSGQQAGQGMGALVAAALLVGPALVPIAAGAAGLAVGLGAMGAAGVLAVYSIVQEMKKGTALGGQYSTMLSGLKDDLATLEKTAATGVLGPFQQTVADLRAKMPALNGVIGDFATITGKTAGALTSGLVAAFLALSPLARDAGTYILNLANRFTAMMSGPGVVTFGDYVRSVFPQVMQAVESIVTAVFHLVAAIAPLGLGSLGILRMLTDVINAIPTDHLAVVIQLASAMYIGFEAFKLLSGPLGALSTALVGVGVSAEVAATGVRTLTIAAGVIGAIIGVATIVYSAFADTQRKNTQAANDFADAIRQDNGALGDNTRILAAKKLQDDGMLATAQKMGISLSDVTDAVLNQGGGMAKLTGEVQAYIATTPAVIRSHGTAGETYNQVQADAEAYLTSVQKLSGTVDDAAAHERDLAAAQAATTATTDPAAAAQQALAEKVGTTVAALALATTGQQTTAQATANAAAKMYIENDAAGILKTSLDLLNGKAMNAAQAQNNFDSSLVNMGDHMSATGQKVHFTTTSIDDMSSASVALRGQLNAQITNLQNVVEANGGLSDSTGKAKAQMEQMRQQIIDNATAHGVDKDAVTAYVDNLLTIPATVPPTKLDVDSAAAQEKATNFMLAIEGIPTYRSVTIDVQTVGSLASTYASQVPHGHALGGLVGHAGGGLIHGPGTSTSDSILGVNGAGIATTRVSNGEYVVNAAASAKNRAALDAINGGANVDKAGNGSTNYVSVSLNMDDLKQLQTLDDFISMIQVRARKA